MHTAEEVVQYQSPQLKYMFTCIVNSQSGQLPLGLIAQLVKNCMGIAEVMGSNLVQALFFVRLSLPNCLSCVHNCNDE